MAIATNTAFGVVTVMDVKVYDLNETKLTVGTGAQAKSIEALYKEHVSQKDFNEALLTAVYPETGTSSLTPLCSIEHLTVATLSTEGPSITINGGKYNNPLIKYGKTARCEMTDALGQMDVLVALGGAEYIDPEHENKGINITDKFGAPVLVLGKSFVVDQKTGRHVPVDIILYQFLPDATPSFAFDSGNAATFDLNGDLLAVEFKSNAAAGMCDEGTGTFFALNFDDCKLSPSEQ